jgi:hypothetical protein
MYDFFRYSVVKMAGINNPAIRKLLLYTSSYIWPFNAQNFTMLMDILLKKPSLLTLAILLVNCLKAQQDSPSLLKALSAELNFDHGFFIADKPKTQYLRSSHANFAELAISAQTSGKKDWQVSNHFPRIGIALMYGSPGSEKYLGKMAAAYPFVRFPLYKNPRFNAAFRLGLGLGWIEKIYNKNSNYKNLVISTHLNACINILLQGEWVLSRRMALNGGFSFTHLSNGSVKVPNLGLNIPALSAGIRYLFNEEPVLRGRAIPSVSKKWQPSVFIFVAGKQTYPLESSVYLVPVLNLELMRNLSATGRYGGGVNIAYDQSLSKEVPDVPVYAFDKSASQLQVSIFGSYEKVLGKLSIPLQLGVYVYNNYVINQLYQNIGIRYRFTRKMSAALQLKTHMGKADYIQWGLGYKL